MLAHIASRALLWAMVFLALGMCGDFYVVSRITGVSMVVSTIFSLLLLLLFFGTWFGYTFWKRRALHNPQLTTSHLKGPSAA